MVLSRGKRQKDGLNTACKQNEMKLFTSKYSSRELLNKLVLPFIYAQNQNVKKCKILS